MAPRLFSSLFLLAASLAGIQAQAVNYTDPVTGIRFLKTTQDSGGHGFGIALPEVGGSDFIGQLSAPIEKGWAGISLTSGMTSGLLVVAWPDGKGGVVASLRKASGYSNPDVYTGKATLVPIPTGVSATATGFTYTFLCKGCVDASGTTSFTPEYGPVPLAWAMSTLAPTSPSDPSTALTSHIGTGGQGIGMYNLDVAKSADYEKWAALASETAPVPPNPPVPGNGTLPGNGTTPVPVPSPGNVTVSKDTYDYIVVGGGGSGIITAQRLVETGKSVLLIERGKASFHSSGGNLTVPWNNTVSVYEVPGMYRWLTSFPGNDALCSDTPTMAGCILGGGTAVNGLAFIKPPSFDFDDKWPAGWKWADVEASAERFYERNPGTITPSADGKHYDYAVYDVLSKNLASAGWKSVNTNTNPHDKSKIFSHPAINVLNGRRAGPVATYLPLAMGKSNFKLLLNTMVLRAVRTNSTITGVEAQLKDGSRQIINVNPGGKVILAAGAMSSPRILFRSGIGPTAQIEVVKTGNTPITLPDESQWINSPVGWVKDHSLLTLNFNVKGGMKIMSETDYTNPSLENIDLWNHASGPLTQSSVMRLNTFRTVVTSSNTSIIVQTHNYAAKNDTISVIFLLTHGTTSTGTLGLTKDGNTVWTESPYLHTADDKEAMATAIDDFLIMSRMANSTISYAGSANDTGAAIVSRMTPGAGVHMTGTTIMGTDDGTKGGKSVVDTNCKVYGTDNLFVVDAGMHADLPTGNTQVIVAVAAEHAVQKIIALEKGGGEAPTTSTVQPSPSATATASGASTDGPQPTDSATSETLTQTVPVESTSTAPGPVETSATAVTSSPAESTASSEPVPVQISTAAPVPTQGNGGGCQPIIPSSSAVQTSSAPAPTKTENPYWHNPGNSHWEGGWGRP